MVAFLWFCCSVLSCCCHYSLVLGYFNVEFDFLMSIFCELQSSGWHICPSPQSRAYTGPISFLPLQPLSDWITKLRKTPSRTSQSYRHPHVHVNKVHMERCQKQTTGLWTLYENTVPFILTRFCRQMLHFRQSRKVGEAPPPGRERYVEDSVSGRPHIGLRVKPCFWTWCGGWGINIEMNPQSHVILQWDTHHSNLVLSHKH